MTKTEERKDFKIYGKVTDETPINMWNDATIKMMFTAKESRNMMIRLLSATTPFTKEELEYATFQSIELPNQKYKEKVKRTDIVVSIPERHDYIITEVNQFPSKTEKDKGLRYMFSVVVKETLEGNKDTARVVELNFDKKNSFKTHKDEPIREVMLRDQFGEVLSDIILSYYFIVENKNQLDYNNPRDRELAKVMSVFSCETLGELKRVTEGDEDYMSMTKKVVSFFQDDTFLNWYNTEEGQASFRKNENQEYLEKGRAEGRTEGRTEERKEMIQKMVDSGMNIPDIAEMLKMDEKEIEAFLNN